MVDKFEVGKKYKYKFPNWEPTHGPYECIFVTPSGSGVLSSLKDGEAIEWVSTIPENYVEVPNPPPRRVLYHCENNREKFLSSTYYENREDFESKGRGQYFKFIGFVSDEDLLKIATKE